jgi:DNA repair exonuclease SbcCD ATPase subunit
MVSEICKLRAVVDSRLGDYRHAARAAKEEWARLRDARAEAAAAVEAQQVLQTVAATAQHEAHTQIARVVTRCLQTVFGEDAYDFGIDFRRARGRTEARLYFARLGRRVEPTSAAGGGVVDVAAFALRLACLLLATPKRRRLLVLDEPFRMLSRDYAARVRELIETLSRELGVQIIQVTHSPDLAAGKVIELS